MQFVKEHVMMPLVRDELLDPGYDEKHWVSKIERFLYLGSTGNDCMILCGPEGIGKMTAINYFCSLLCLNLHYYNNDQQILIPRSRAYRTCLVFDNFDNSKISSAYFRELIKTHEKVIILVSRTTGNRLKSLIDAGVPVVKAVKPSPTQLFARAFNLLKMQNVEVSQDTLWTYARKCNGNFDDMLDMILYHSCSTEILSAASCLLRMAKNCTYPYELNY